MGDFTLPGESGYEKLTLRLAKAWGADTVRDSDGTALSPEILDMGYKVYSTICLVRSVNSWAREHRDKLQQNYLMSFPIVARSSSLAIDLLKGYSRDQFVVNAADDPKTWWQVHDRTTGDLVPAALWDLDAASGTVTVRDARPWHAYTVDFLVYRIWEEISMYNHVTNDWGDRERLMAVEPAYPETQEVLLAYLDRWLDEHPRTDVVRFTSLFYNFCWIWGDDPDLRFVYSDWASYDFSVNPYMMRRFEARKGYRPTAEDFINGGLRNSTHNPPTRAYGDWMDFIQEFVADFGRRCVEKVHARGRKAYVFYDDHWIGVEPYGPRFAEIGFDGIIKCVFNAFEARLCAAVPAVETRELRLHPYLFPTGLTGEPTFAPGGNPAGDAKRFWVTARRALLREGVDRIGLGGYPHLVEPFPDFIEAVAGIAEEFRALKALHARGKPYRGPCRVAVLTAWGRLRSWSCSGHMHEHPELELIRVLEALAGLPVDVEFLDFQDLLREGTLERFDVLLNAGRAGSAWSGGAPWADPAVVERVSSWVAAGGGFIGVGEPTAATSGIGLFRLAQVLGVDRETGMSIARSQRAFRIPEKRHFILEDLPETPEWYRETDGIFRLDAATTVLAARGGNVRIAVHPFGRGRAVYLSGFHSTPPCFRLLHRAAFWAAGREEAFRPWTCSDIGTECAWFPESGRLVVINDGGEPRETDVFAADGGRIHVALPPYGIRFLEIAGSAC